MMFRHIKFRFPKCLLYVQTININCQIILLCEHLFPGSYNFIRLSRRVLCYCSSGFQISTMLTVPDPECNVKCKGNIRQYCGGNGGDYFVYSAFEVYTPGKYSLHNEHRIQVRQILWLFSTNSIQTALLIRGSQCTFQLTLLLLIQKLSPFYTSVRNHKCVTHSILENGILSCLGALPNE